MGGTPTPVPGISVVLPAYNEQENLGEAVGQALEVLPELVDGFEVIVVDDGSTDGTREVALELLEPAPPGRPPGRPRAEPRLRRRAAHRLRAREGADSSSTPTPTTSSTSATSSTSCR